MPTKHLAINNVCGWPTLTLLPDKTLCTLVFNQPCHGLWEGDVECWASPDGVSWQKQSVVAPRENGSNRMNVAVGLNAHGELVALCAGWYDRPPMGSSERRPFRKQMPATVCLSTDHGKTWRHCDGFPKHTESRETEIFTPFGDICQDESGKLFATAYCGRVQETPAHALSCFVSEDHGQHWQLLSCIGPENHNEAALLYLGDQQWLVAARTLSPADLELFRSVDHGKTWQYSGKLSLPLQHPANLRRLTDGSILLTYGNRCKNMTGIDLRRSKDNGVTWSAPVRLVSLDATDLGYPSTVQLADESLVTLYYANRDSHVTNYHVGAVTWKLDELF